jgi:hypothetical protein
MFSMIFGALGGVRTILIASAMAVVAGLGMWILHIIEDRATLQANNAVLEQTIKTNQKALDDLKTQHDIDLKTIESFHGITRIIDSKTGTILKELRNVPLPKACERDPAIDLVLDSLRQLHNNGTRATPNGNSSTK